MVRRQGCLLRFQELHRFVRTAYIRSIPERYYSFQRCGFGSVEDIGGIEKFLRFEKFFRFAQFGSFTQFGSFEEFGRGHPQHQPLFRRFFRNPSYGKRVAKQKYGSIRFELPQTGQQQLQPFFRQHFKVFRLQFRHPFPQHLFIWQRFFGQQQPQFVQPQQLIQQQPQQFLQQTVFELQQAILRIFRVIARRRKFGIPQPEIACLHVRT